MFDDFLQADGVERRLTERWHEGIAEQSGDATATPDRARRRLKIESKCVEATLAREQDKPAAPGSYVDNAGTRRNKGGETIDVAGLDLRVFVNVRERAVALRT
jgi:hypothetical protein